MLSGVYDDHARNEAKGKFDDPGLGRKGITICWGDPLCVSGAHGLGYGDLVQSVGHR